jgi:hypothetical protein
MKKNPVAIPFFVAIMFSLLWSGVIAVNSYRGTLSTSAILPFETLRNTAWLFLLSAIMVRQRSNINYYSLFRSHTAQFLALLIGLVFVLESNSNFRYSFQQFIGQDPRLFAHVIFAIVGLMLVEQIYRNAVIGFRWAIKFLCIGLGGLFIIDFIVYSKSLLFSKLDSSLWDTRGIINALIVPLLAISCYRLQSETIKIAISRKIAFHTTVLFGTGLYLILMSLAGIYIRDYGGNWGEIAQIIFIFLAILLLLILFVAGFATLNVRVTWMCPPPKDVVAYVSSPPAASPAIAVAAVLRPQLFALETKTVLP